MTGFREYELAVPAGTARLRVAAASDVGAVRRINEDSSLAVPPLFAVADGMGGHAFGDRASQAAVASLAAEFAPDAPADPERLVSAVGRANDAVRDLTSWDGDDRMIAGTTLVCLAFVELDVPGAYRWMVVNVGDSRAYRWADGLLTQLSVDHSVVQELIDAGELTDEEALDFPDRNVVTRALGATDVIEADVWLLPASGEQTFLLCSDGLSKELRDAEIAAVLADGSLDSAADRLVAAAIEAGGGDNVTVVIVQGDIPGATVDDRIDRMPSHLEDTRPRV